MMFTKEQEEKMMLLMTTPEGMIKLNDILSTFIPDDVERKSYKDKLFNRFVAIMEQENFKKIANAIFDTLNAAKVDVIVKTLLTEAEIDSEVVITITATKDSVSYSMKERQPSSQSQASKEPVQRPGSYKVIDGYKTWAEALKALAPGTYESLSIGGKLKEGTNARREIGKLTKAKKIDINTLKVDGNPIDQSYLE